MQSDDSGGLNHKLKNYQDKLLQITTANRCICVKKIYNRHNFDLSRLLENHSEKINLLAEQSIKRKKSICILPDSDNSDNAITMQRNLKSLSRNIKQLEDETGSQYCYFGFPFLEGHLTSDHYVRGPLVLFPISVYHGQVYNKVGWYVKFIDQPPIFNHTLFTLLEKIGGYKMNESFEADFEDALYSIPTEGNIGNNIIQKISSLLAKHGLSVELPKPEHPDLDIKYNETLSLKNMYTSEIKSLEKQPLKIQNYKIIGSFPQGESAIYQDYENLIKEIQNGNTNDFISDILDEIDEPPNYDEDDLDKNIEKLDEIQDEDLNLILPSDSSQDQVVLASQHRKATLVRGPPGTGKSQVIVNIISNALSKNQKVLVVCQKRAALEVVHQRLGSKDLDKYTVLLNKEKEDRAKMYLQLKQILEYTHHTSDNSQYIQNASQDIDKLVLRHSEIFEALTREYFGGITIGKLYVRSHSNYTKRLDISKTVNEVNFPQLDSFLYDLKQIEENYKKFENNAYAWKNRKGFSNNGSSVKNKIEEILSAILSKSQNYLILSDTSNQNILIDLISTYSSLTSKVAELGTKIENCTKSINEISDSQNMPMHLADLEDLSNRVTAGIILWDKFPNYDEIMNIAKNKILEDDYKKQMDLLGTFLTPIENSSFWKKLTDSEIKRKIALKNEFLERPVAAGKNRDDLRDLLENGLKLWNLAQNSTLGNEYIFEKLIILDNDPDQRRLHQDIIALKKHQAELKIKSDELQSSVRALCDLFKKNGLNFDAYKDDKQLVIKADNGIDMLSQIDLFSEFVTNEEIQTINSKIPDHEHLLSHIQNLSDHMDDFDMLQSFELKKARLNPAQQYILEQCMSSLQLEENWHDIIEQEIYVHWIETIERDNPILREGFDDYGQNQERLASLLKKKSELLVEKIINSIESNTNFGSGMGINRSSSSIEYTKLSHELGKKRRVMSIRNLFEQYKHILLDIAPCWLASPEMVSNIFPLEQNLFDIIIVDEASQLAAERSLPFLYRGKRLIIAGDEKQLKPYDLFQIKEEDDEEDEVVNIESLLLLAKRRSYTSTTLQWHYRSEWQELIDFSNHAFYNDSLKVSPNVQREPPTPPIEWVDCPRGLWENRSNVAESAKVVDKLYEILQNYKAGNTPTIGIITFNDEQKNRILDEIEKRKNDDPMFDKLYKNIEFPASGKKDDEIFVRNIEHVQGDERDIIIFSIGYAKDFEGNFRLHFGTLNMDGGENRLNVAITRASKKIIVVCSINPRDMKVENTKNPGPKHLRNFLMYANAISQRDGKNASKILESLGSGVNNAREHTKIFDSKFEELVCERLENLGYSVQTQVGESGYRIDLAIVHPNDSSRYILGVECDGATFHSGKSVRERDVMRQQFLERRKWTIERIWSRNWWRNPDKEIQRIKQRVDSILDSQNT